MTRLRSLVTLVTLLVPVALLLGADPAPPTPREVRDLVAKLGSEDFAEREAAAKQLEELGTTAIEELRAGLKSESAETVRRAQELLRKAERRLLNERLTAPTLVELDTKEQPLDAVLAELSKQAKCEVVLGGLKTEVVAAKKITVATGGKVPFWAAVLKVCDAGELQVAGAGGFVAPGAMPYLGRASAGVRVASNTQRAVVLEARGDAPKRPAFVSGAVLVQALPLPKTATPDAPTALLQAWPELRVQWESMPALKVVKAVDDSGSRLATETLSGGVEDPLHSKRGGFVLGRNPDGTPNFNGYSGFPSVGNFRPNVRQSVVRVTGNPKTATAKELDVALFANVRSPVEPLSRAVDLKPNAGATGTGNADVELSVTYGPGGNGRPVASIDVTYDPRAVHPANVSDELVGTKGGGPGGGNGTVYGIRVTDAEGKPYNLGLSSGVNQYEPSGRRIVLKLKLELHADKDGHGPPSVVTFWGTSIRQVEIPARLKDVPLTGAK